MKTILLSTLLVVTACCTSPRAKVAEAQAPKPGAPTELQSELGQNTAKLSLRFERAGENVSVLVSGIDGVAVTSPPEVLSGVPVKRGEVRSFEVAFTGRGHLVISVRGTFSGATQARVHTVAIGEVVKQKNGTTQVTDDGDAVKVMP